MKIIYDNIIFSLQNAGGISNYWFQLSYRLLKSSYNVKFIERRNSKNLYRIELNTINNNVIRSIYFPLLIDRFLNIQTTLNEKFIFHSSYNRITKNINAIQVLTVHDLIHEKFYTGLRKHLHVYQKKIAIKNASHIIAVSENTKNDLLSFYPSIKEENITVIYNGVSEQFTCLQEINENYILYIGSREKYKNFRTIVQLLSTFKEFKLVIVGSKLSIEETEHLNSFLKDRWEIHTGLSNDDLNILYNKAFALLYPSSYEGFGIPLLEAMRAGCPFIALNNSSIPEVAGEAGIILDKLTIDSLSTAFADIKLNREIIKSKGFIQSKKFSWDKSYKETVSLYEKLLNENINNNGCL